MKGRITPSANVLCKVALVSVLLQICFSFDLFDDDSHQGLMSRLEKPSFLSLLDDKKQQGGDFLPGGLNRKLFRLPQTIIPYPRAGRMILDPDSLIMDYDLVQDYVMDYLDSGRAEKRFRFPPRIGRKKRSIEDDKVNSRSSDEEWSDLDQELFRSDRAEGKSRGRLFVPRVGKKSVEGMIEDIEEGKRALAFTPRIGRAVMVPRIGRNDPRFKVKSRGAFIPRIGRRAFAFVPRVGRNEGRSRDSE